MPTYEAVCDECGNKFDYTARVSEYDLIPMCPMCDSGLCRRIFTVAPMGFVKGKFEPYRSQVDGSLIRTQRDLEAHNKRNNVVLLGEGYDEQTILDGKCAPPPPRVDRKEITKDIQEAMAQLEQGYKPVERAPLPFETDEGAK
jgi:putative FmdB family regulatory protein